MNSSYENRLRPAAVYRPWLHGLAVLTAVLTFPLLLSGGSVTVYRVGMAVPDWPTTFGVNMFLFNMLESSWGVQLEHSHRLLGTLVGLSCIAVFLGFLLFEPRRWLKWLALADAGGRERARRAGRRARACGFRRTWRFFTVARPSCCFRSWWPSACGAGWTGRAA